MRIDQWIAQLTASANGVDDAAGVALREAAGAAGRDVMSVAEKSPRAVRVSSHVAGSGNHVVLQLHASRRFPLRRIVAGKMGKWRKDAVAAGRAGVVKS